MIKFSYVEVADCGFHYAILSIVPNTIDACKDSFLPLSTVAEKMIIEAVQGDRKVLIKKPIMSNEVMPNDLIISDITNDLEVIKHSALIKAKTLVTPEITKESGYTLYEFIVYHDELMEEGYVITNKNREQKYMDIIETEDEELIELLENYLEAKDKIARGFFIKKKYDKLSKAVLKSKTQEEIENLVNTFIDKTFKVG